MDKQGLRVTAYWPKLNLDDLDVRGPMSNEDVCDGRSYSDTTHVLITILPHSFVKSSTWITLCMNYWMDHKLSSRVWPNHAISTWW